MLSSSIAVTRSTNDACLNVRMSTVSIASYKSTAWLFSN